MGRDDPDNLILIISEVSLGTRTSTNISSRNGAPKLIAAS